MNAEKETDFESWAKSLIRRKVPDDYQHLINQEIIRDGEIILRRGDAFEIHIRSQNSQESVSSSSRPNPKGAELQITPLIYRRRAAGN